MVSSVQAEQTTYYPSWSQACVISAVWLTPIVAVSLVTARSAAAALVPFACLVPLAVVAIRYFGRVHVSAGGLRGLGKQTMKWSDVTEVEQTGLGSLIVKSASVPAISLAKSIADDPRFRDHVSASAPPGHALATKLGSARDRRAS